MTRTAEACACCDSSTTRAPIGWTPAGGALLIDMQSNAACSKTHLLEVWTIGAAEPAGCYDLLNDPDKRVSCGIGADSFSAIERPSSQVKRFSNPARALPASDVRLTSKPVRDSDTVRVTVDVMTKDGWHRVWSGSIVSAKEVTDAAGQTTPTMALQVTVWPNPRGDRALMLLTPEGAYAGSGAWTMTVRWVTLPG